MDCYESPAFSGFGVLASGLPVSCPDNDAITELERALLWFDVCLRRSDCHTWGAHSCAVGTGDLGVAKTVEWDMMERKEDALDRPER